MIRGFSGMVGQRMALEQLQKGLQEKRLSHAYLFVGPPGVGKRTAALLMAKALHCRVNSVDPCGTCSSCQQVDHGNHPDVYRIEPEGSYIKIEQIRNLQKNLKFKTYGGGAKVVLIFAAHQMQGPAANSLLKMLEEPQGDTIFILVSDRGHALLPTVLSRCISIAFGRLSEEEIFKLLQERTALPESQARTIARISDGSGGKALEMASDEGALALRDRAIAFLEELPGLDPTRLSRHAEEWDKEKELLPGFLEHLSFWLRDAMVERVGGGQGMLVNQDRLDSFREAPESEKLTAALTSVMEARKLLAQQVNTRIVLEVLFIRLSKLLRKRG